MNRLIIIVRLKIIINFNQSPFIRTLYKKYINPLKDVKHEKNPLTIIFSFDLLNLFEITKPKQNDPINETIKLLFKKTLKKVAEKQAKRKLIRYFIFIE